MKLKSKKVYLIDKSQEQSPIAYAEYNEKGQEILSISYNEGVESEKVEAEYDSKGLKTVEIFHFIETEVTESTHYLYDESGRIVQEILKYEDGSEFVKNYDRDLDAKTLTIISLDEDSEEERIVLTFNEKEQVIERASFDEDGKFKERFVFEFEGENLIREQEMDKKGTILFETTFGYDANQNEIKRVKRTAKGGLVEAAYYSYDEKNRLIEQKVGGYTIKNIFDDEKISCTTQRFSATGMLESEKVTLYDAENRIVEESSAQGVIRYEYEFYEV